MIILFVFIFISLFFLLIGKTKKIKTATIYLDLNIELENIDDKIKSNESKLYEFICENIDIVKFKENFYEIVKQYNLVITNKMIYDNSLNIPNGRIFKYIFNQESCKMLLYEGIFCELIIENKQIPLHIVISSKNI